MFSPLPEYEFRVSHVLRSTVSLQNMVHSLYHGLTSAWRLSIAAWRRTFPVILLCAYLLVSWGVLFGEEDTMWRRISSGLPTDHYRSQKQRSFMPPSSVGLATIGTLLPSRDHPASDRIARNSGRFACTRPTVIEWEDWAVCGQTGFGCESYNGCPSFRRFGNDSSHPHRRRLPSSWSSRSLRFIQISPWATTGRLRSD